LSACSANALAARLIDADSSGKIDVYCFAPSHETIGAEQIVAKQAVSGDLSACDVAVPVLTEAGSMQPPEGD
jgi:hypothetical protein